MGDPAKIEEILVSLDQNPSDFVIEPVPEGTHPSVCAAKLIHEGRADFLMKGKIMTGDMLKGVLCQEADLRTGRLMSHIIIAEVPVIISFYASPTGGMCTYPDWSKKDYSTKRREFLYSLGYGKM